ncbi:hypothetical protein H310_03270 [Aphanomyces invadans]|uniref:Uncharacterized protein n=1 Tax=Aphanomyces invadans TaxID=157072 RepID=A0A024UIT7_9STRA|nr:hypothetical protein H310_03270 [Aphanomyces invadans]ETW05513.1 hypothetical protein H310_03270 [Aphanomyces invadans]|eukprot:XP_008865290.1 hypothetical protein H310_03270 [Aphanomyces invadans]
MERSSATVLTSQELVDAVVAYDHGVRLDMVALISVAQPIKSTLFAPFHAAIPPRHDQWRHSGVVQQLASMPRIQNGVVAHALWSGNLPLFTRLPVELL